MIDRPGLRRDDTGRQVSGKVPQAKADAAMSMFVGAGMAVEVVDELTWRVGGCVFRPASGLWTGPGGVQGYGAGTLIARLRAAAAPDEGSEAG
jgi:hypothetical protein